MKKLILALLLLTTPAVAQIVPDGNVLGRSIGGGAGLPVNVPIGTMFGGATSPAVGNHSQIGPTPLAIISRMGDRLFVGKNTNVNDGGFDGQNVTKDWLETLLPNTTSEAVVAAVSTNTLAGTGGGGISLLGAQRTSDQGTHAPADVEGIAGYGICDTAMTQAGFPGCWAGYFEAHKNSAATGVNSYGIEVDMLQLGTSSLGANVNPYGILNAGQTIGLNVASGAGNSSAHTADTALLIAQNPSNFLSGITFQPSSIFGTNGSDSATCCGNAIQLAREQAITFWSSSNGFTGQNVVNVYSSVQSGNVGTDIQFINGGIAFTNHTSGLNMMTVSNTNITTLGALLVEGGIAPTGQVVSPIGQLTVGQASVNELDLINTYENAAGGFIFYQMTGVSTKVPVLNLSYTGGFTALNGGWPTSCSGQAAGTLWNSSGTIHVC